MMRSVLAAIWMLALVLTLAPPASAQGVAWEGRWYVALNGSYQATNHAFSESFAFDLYVEQATVNTSYVVEAGPSFDGGLGVRLWRNLGVGVTLARFTATSSAPVRASIPHPFFFDRNREVNGDATGLKRTETAAHVQLVFFVPASERIQLLLSVGPSFVDLEQTLVREVRYTDSYPFDTVTFQSADLTRARNRAFGFNVGADVLWRISRSFGAGALVRFTRATMTLAPADGRSVSVETGGAQVGGGIRLFF